MGSAHETEKIVAKTKRPGATHSSHWQCLKSVTREALLSTLDCERRSSKAKVATCRIACRAEVVTFPHHNQLAMRKPARVSFIGSPPAAPVVILRGLCH